MFEFMTAGVAVGDFNMDGFPDVFLPSVDSRSTLYENTGQSSFVDVTVASGIVIPKHANGAAFVDVDADGLV